jgi:hypothetical protein
MNPVLIEDSNFLSKEEQQYFLDLIFKDEENPKIKWTLRGLLPSLNWKELNTNNIFPFEPTPLALNHPKSKAQLQIIGNLENNEHLFVFDKFCQKHGIEYKKILRAKINIITMDNEDYHNFIHIDAPIKHKVFLYYLNDSDGDTLFFNKNFNDKIDSELVVDYSVTPKAGKAIVFDGMRWHSSTPPKNNQLRIILNIDYIEKE